MAQLPPSASPVLSLEERPTGGRLFSSILIDPFRQIKFGLYMMALSIAFVLASMVIFGIAFREQYQHVLEIFSIIDHQRQWDTVVNTVFITNLVRLVVFFGIFLAAMFLVVFRLTHRYYGPLVSIERFLDEIIEGRYGARIAIRSRDELQLLANKLNQLAVVLEQRHGASNEPVDSKVQPPGL